MQLLDLNILQRPLLNTFDAASLLAVLYLLARPGLTRLRTAGLAVAAGAAAGVLTLLICEAGLNIFGLPLDTDTRAWVVAAFGGVALALANLWRTRWWRKIAAVAAIALFISTAALGINAAYGLNATLGALLGLNTTGHLALPKLDPKPVSRQPLWKTWKAPAGMPASGRSGAVTIPATASGFRARDARLYLPPAALVPNPPPLPVLVMMMGQPGGPEQDKSSVRELNALARQNHGLAPITLTIDQLGNPFINPVCVDSDMGKVYTYVTKDVVNYIRRNLNVDPRRAEWAVGGYSNGGECALSFGAKRPDLFGTILDISGELKPLNGTEAHTVSVIFKGNHEAFAAEEPANIMKARRYPDELAIFTSGSLDRVYGPQAAAAAQDAQEAGMRTRSFVGNGVGHRGDALDFGVRTGLPLLYPRFGLTAGPAAPG
ncbi:alpha/beta hydrolase-fold protein [Arthrobacter sp. NPDC058097]|uniref:alpha/beta hydrolase-fold protein n=1 Tax=Arthrobacter sp. NPDC058097 TaxID=3346340 RepID=UPI0036DB5718